MLKKATTILLIIGILIGILGHVQAVDLSNILEVVQAESETKYLEKDQGFLSKKIVETNPSTGEVTIELKLSNTAKETEENTEPEIFFVMDNSSSMSFVTASGKTRKEIVIESAKKLTEKIYSNSTNAKIGLVDFHGDLGGFSFEGIGINNASLKVPLTNNKDTIINGLNTLLNGKTESGTNIDAGLQKAEKNFSKKAKNKIIILLTDGVPNADVKGNSSGNNVTTEAAIKIQEETKLTLQRLEKENYYLISMMTGINQEDGNTDEEGNIFDNPNTVEEELQAIERTFGTAEKPTAGKYYLTKSADIDQIVQNDIFKDVMEKVQKPIHTIKIVDYFPKDIIENFTFSYVSKQNIGTISKKIDQETKSIQWQINTLKGNEVASVKYKLKLKDMKNTDLLNKTMATNEKVVMTYLDKAGENYTVTLTSSPQIKLTEVKEQNKSTDNTVAGGKLPKAGTNIIIAISILGLLAIAILIYAKYHSYHDIK